MNHYRELLVTVLGDIVGTYQRDGMVLGRFEAMANRAFEAQRQLEALDMRGAQVPAAERILRELLDETEGAKERYRFSEAVDRARAALQRARVMGEASS